MPKCMMIGGNGSSGGGVCSDEGFIGRLILGV